MNLAQYSIRDNPSSNEYLVQYTGKIQSNVQPNLLLIFYSIFEVLEPLGSISILSYILAWSLLVYELIDALFLDI
jgi:hypothetical protein